jgi:signal transduction histidine kinase
VLQNLLTNAIKYSPDGGDILVRVEDDPSRREARFVVSDAGIGMPPEALPRLFSRFYRVDETLTSGDGLGLGLYICRSLVEAHGGRIEVESAPGCGSSFTVRLPYTPV